MFKKTFSFLTSEWKMGFCSVSGIWFRLKDISRIEIKEAAWYISMNSKLFFGGKSNHIDHTFSVSTWTFIHAFCAKLAASFFVNQKENSDVGSIPIRYQNPDTSSTISWSVPEAWPAKWHYALHSSSFLSLLCKVRPSTSVRIMMLLKMYHI